LLFERQRLHPAGSERVGPDLWVASRSASIHGRERCGSARGQLTVVRRTGRSGPRTR
jgi:hypothetical protein